MPTDSLTTLAQQHLQLASAAESGRSVHRVYGGQEHMLGQVLIAFRAGASLREHENPGEATVQVLLGQVVLVANLVANQERWEGSAGDLLVIPQARHALEAIEDSVVLLTMVKKA